MTKPIVAIDGPAGSGKSTVAKIAAKRLGFLYINTGAMYRSLALKAIRAGKNLEDKEGIIKMAKETVINLVSEGSDYKVLLDGEDVSGEIRTEEVSAKTKIVAAIGGVRMIIRTKQQEMGKPGGVVMEGRDIGTQVFPGAEYKFYIDASVEERAKRRFLELKNKGEAVNIEEIKRRIIERDDKDKTRKESPLTVAKSAVVIDTSNMTIEEVTEKIVNIVKAGGSPVAEGADASEKVVSSNLFYTGRAMFRFFFGIFWRMRIEGHENIPKSGGILIAPNHNNAIDPPLTGSAMRRPLHFMAKKELFSVPILGFLIKRTNAFPVDRGKQDVGAFKKVFNLLKSGEALLVFPEGTRSKDGNFGKARPGLGMIACTAQVPAVPVRLVNSDKLKGFKKLKVIFGKPVYPPKEYSKDDYLRFSETVLEEIKKL